MKMKLTQSELDLLAPFPAQLIEMRDILKTFDLQIDPDKYSECIQNALQDDFRVLHNQLCSMVSTMQRYIDAGAA